VRSALILGVGPEHVNLSPDISGSRQMAMSFLSPDLPNKVTLGEGFPDY